MAEFISINLLGQKRDRSGTNINDGPIIVSTKLTVGMLHLVVRKHLEKDLEGIRKLAEGNLEQRVF